MKTFRTVGSGSTQTLEQIENNKIPVYETKAAAEADIANLSEGQIIATKDEGNENAKPVDVVESGNMHAVTSNAVADAFSYSTEEVKTGGTWIDGKPIYRKVLSNIITGTTQDIAHQIANIDSYVNLTPYMVSANDSQLFPSFNTGSYYFTVFASSKTVLVLQCVSGYIGNLYRVVVEYTKTTD